MAKIQIRRGTANQWVSEDPILVQGELGYETDTNKLKVGKAIANDLNTQIPWTALDYFAYKDVVVEDIATTTLLDNYDTDVGRLVYDQATKEVFVYDGENWISVSTGNIPTPNLNEVCKEGFYTNTPIFANDFKTNPTGGVGDRSYVEAEELNLRAVQNDYSQFYGVTLKAPDLMSGTETYTLELPGGPGDVGSLLMKGESNSLIWASPFPYEQLKLNGRYTTEYDLIEAQREGIITPVTGDLYLISQYHGFFYATTEEFNEAYPTGNVPYEKDHLLLFVENPAIGGSDQGSWTDLGQFTTVDIPGSIGPQGPQGPKGDNKGVWSESDTTDPTYIIGRNEYIESVFDDITTTNSEIIRTNTELALQKNEIINLQQELENALPSLNRAEYALASPQVLQSSVAGIGYTANVDLDTGAIDLFPSYEDTSDLFFNQTDINGVDQQWQTFLDEIGGVIDSETGLEGIKRNYVIEIRNLTDDSFAVFEILPERTSWSSGYTQGPNATIKIGVKATRFQGSPTIDTNIVVKIYTTQDVALADLDLRYVRKAYTNQEISLVPTFFEEGLTIRKKFEVDATQLIVKTESDTSLQMHEVYFSQPVNNLTFADGRYYTTRLHFQDKFGLVIQSSGLNEPLLRLGGVDANGQERLTLDIKADGSAFWVLAPYVAGDTTLIDPYTEEEKESIKELFEGLHDKQLITKFYVDRSIEFYTDGRFFDLNSNFNVITGNTQFKKTLVVQASQGDGDTTSNALTIYGGYGEIGLDPNTQLNLVVKINGDITSQGTSLSMVNAATKLNTLDVSHITLKSAITSSTPSTRAVTKKYVDDRFNHVKNNNYYVPVGSIMMWLGSNVPTGWFFLNGGNFNTSTYNQLHNYLRNYVSGYSSGVLPNWNDRYFVQNGPNSGQNLGGKIPWKTAVPKGDNKIVIASSNVSMPKYQVKSGMGAGTGSGQTVLRSLGSGAGGAEVYNIPAAAGTDKGTHNHSFSGGDEITRPDSVVGRYIIRGDYK